MLTRFLGGMAACLGAAGVLAAQQAPPPAKPTPPTARLTGVQPAPAANPFYLPSAQSRTAPAARLAKVTADAAPPVTPKALPATLPQTPTGALLTTCPSYADCGECPTSCLPCCEPCGPAGRFWADVGFIFWTTKGQALPPLVTAAPVGTARPVAGVLGQPGTTTLFGGRRVNDDWRGGFYLNAGMWLDPCQTCGIEGNFFFLGEDRENFAANSPGSAVITRPFTNALTGAGDTELVSFPGVLSGGVTVNTRSNVIGGGPNMVKNLCCDPCGRTDLLLGYQYFNLRDEVVIREDLTSLPGATNVPPGTRFLIEDRFRSNNNFHGGTIGLATERRFGGRWFVGARAAVALGVNRMTYDISGSTVITPPGGPSQTFAGGLLTQPSNIGRFTRSEFAVLPSIGVKLGAQITDRARVYVGYDYLYLSTAARAGDQIDLRVNPSQLPPRTNPTGPAAPTFTPRTTDFWAQGIRVGLEVRY